MLTIRKVYEWLIASPLGRVLAHRLVVATLGLILGGLAAVGLEFAPEVAACLEQSSEFVSKSFSPAPTNSAGRTLPD